MKCINCGGEIKSEFNNCPYCGKPVQIVPNYTIYDENDINLVLENSLDAPKAKATHIPTQNSKKAKQDRTTKTLIIIASICVVLLLGAIVVKVGIDLSNASSYEYQMKMADSAMFKMDYGQAETYYLNALNIPTENIGKVVVTHWHGDHIAGISEIIKQASKNVKIIINPIINNYKFFEFISLIENQKKRKYKRIY